MWTLMATMRPRTLLPSELLVPMLHFFFQVQNLAVRGGGINQSLLPSLTTATITPHPVTTSSQPRTGGNPEGGTSAKNPSTESRGTTGRTLIPITAHPVITPGETVM